jgi:hypothetical protein
MLEIFGGNLIERTGGYTSTGNAQSLGLGQNFFVLQT